MSKSGWTELLTKLGMCEVDVAFYALKPRMIKIIERREAFMATKAKKKTTAKKKTAKRK